MVIAERPGSGYAPADFLNRSKYLPMATLQWFGFSLGLTASVALGLVGGCADEGTGAQGSTSSSGTGGGGGSDRGGLPCDVESLLASKCVSCHNSPPASGAPMPLLSQADFLAHSK